LASRSFRILAPTAFSAFLLSMHAVYQVRPHAPSLESRRLLPDWRGSVAVLVHLQRTRLRRELDS
jgi:hypothetical protein